tara:strand:- start:40 stop:294 length:255 start_codon:yes stop_codon:yes gene_type:complete
MQTSKFFNVNFKLFLIEEGGSMSRGVLEAMLQDLFKSELDGRELGESLPEMTITTTQTKSIHEAMTSDWWTECFKVDSIKFENN